MKVMCTCNPNKKKCAPLVAVFQPLEGDDVSSKMRKEELRSRV